jgi:hypothetical protein
MKYKIPKPIALGTLAVFLAASALHAAAPPAPQGFITAREYLNIGGGTAVSDLTGSAKFQAGAPDIVAYPPRLEWPTGWVPGQPGVPSPDDTIAPPSDYKNNYGVQILGYVYPPTTGQYTFAIASDDGGQLWLSTDQDPANRALIATEPQWNPVRSFGATDRRAEVAGRRENWSAPITLTAGQAYYIEALMKEGGGGDNLAVAWAMPGETPATVLVNGAIPIRGIYLSSIDRSTASSTYLRGFTGNLAGIFWDVIEPADTVNRTTVSMTLDGATVTPSYHALGGNVLRVYHRVATPLVAGSTHVGVLTYTDTGGNQVTLTQEFTVANYATIPASYALAANATVPGLVVNRVHQMTVARSPNGNSIASAEMQLSGGMTDAEGVARPNIAENAGPIDIGGADTGNFLWTRYVNWEQSGGITTAAGNFTATQPAGEPGTAVGAYSDEYFPGVAISGSPVDPDNFVMETIAYIQLSAGIHRWGVNSDDGFKVTATPGAGSVFGVTLGQYDGGRGAEDTIFDFVVETAGYYPIRLLHWEGDGGASAEWFSQDIVTGQKILIGDTDYYPTAAYQAFRTGQGRARVTTMRPSHGFAGTQPTGPFYAQITDGRTTVSNARLFIDGNQVATGTKAGAVTTINYTPTPPWPLASTLSGQIVYDESGQAESITNNFSFTTRAYGINELPANSFWIEAEDFDYGSGQHVAAASTMPYAGGAYQGLNPVVGVDYQDSETGQFNAETGAFTDGVTNYRGDSRTGPNPILSNISSETGGTLTLARPNGFTMTANYKIGWVGGSDWWNYTRNIPAGVYQAMAAQSRDQSFMFSHLHRVTEGAGTANQTTSYLGTFRGTGGTAWSQNALIPLLASDTEGAPMAAFQLPGGPVTLRWQGGGGDHDWMVLIPVTVPVPPTVRIVSPTDVRHSVFRDTTVRVQVDELTSQVQETGVSMTFDGQAVTPQYTRNGSTVTITYDPPGLLDIGRVYPFTVRVSDNATPANVVNLEGTLVPHYLPGSPAGMFLIEAEDFNTGGGNVQPLANTMPYLGNAYTNLSAVAGTDYLRVGDEPMDGGQLAGNVYRIGESPNVPMGANQGSVTDPIQVFDLVRAMDADRNITWQMDVNFALGWAGQGHWFNYTRNIPNGTYQIWAAMSFDGTAAGQLNATLDRVVGSASVPDAEQVKQPLGVFNAPGSGGWGNNRLVPLRDTPTSPVKAVELGGTTTLRWNMASGDLDYLMLVPTALTPPVEGPVITSITIEPDGRIRVAWEDGTTLQRTTSLPATTWENVSGTSPVLVDPPAAGTVFFRVQE